VKAWLAALAFISPFSKLLTLSNFEQSRKPADFLGRGGLGSGDNFAAGLRNDVRYGDIGSSESGDDLALAQARSVVLKGDLIFGFVVAETAQAVNVGEFAEVA